MSFTVYQAKPLLDLIGKHEGRGDYNIVYGGIPEEMRPEKLTALTLAQLISLQEYWRKVGMKSTAAGKYQIIYKTLLATIDQMKISKNVKFSETLQDEMACHLLKGRSFQKYLDGSISVTDMMIHLSKEWASFPVPFAMRGNSRNVSAGQSYYAGDGLNKAHATIDEVASALAESRGRYRSGSSPSPVGSTSDSKSWVVVAFAAIAAALIFFLKG